MTGALWASQDQTEFLWTFISDYYKINKGSKNYVPFWTRLREKWFELYPEHEVCFPEKDMDDLLPDEEAQLTKNIQARIRQLKTWFRWRVNPRATTGGRRGRLADLEPFEERTCQLKDYEMYSKLYYDEKIKPIVEEVEDELGSMDLSKGEKLNLRKRIARDLYDGEDDDVKELVIAKLKERAKVMEDQKNDLDRTPAQYLRFINDAPGTLGRCLDALHVGSGWTYLVVMGGPHPLSNGEIAVASYSTGPEGDDFGQTYPDIQEQYMARFTEHLEQIYPEATRLERALTNPLETDDQDDLSPATPATDATEASRAPKKKPAKRKSPSKTTAEVVDRQRTSTTSSEASVTLPNASTAVPTASVMTNIADPRASNLTDNSPTTNLNTETTSMSVEELSAECTFRFPDDHSNPHVESSMSLKELNEDPTMMGMRSNRDNNSWWALDINPQFPAFNSSDLVLDTTAFGLQNEQFLSSSSTSTGFNQHFPPTFNSPNLSFDTSPAFDYEQFSRPSSTLTDFTSIVPNNIPSFSFPSAVAPLAAVNASQPPSQLIGASHFMQFQPSPAPVPAFPHTAALLHTIAPTLVNESPSNASSQMVVPGDAPQHIPAASNALSQPTATPVLVSPQYIPATGNALPQPTTTPVSPQHILATSSASPQPSTQPAVAPGDASSPPTAQNTVSSQHAAATALFSVSGTSVSDLSSVSLTQADGRRSGRNPVPSKRHEQMNEIDGKGNNKATGSAHIEKENIPSTTPEWTIASHEHLLKSDLGEDWTACVRAWYELEEVLGYGSQAGAKGALPLAATRPQEWVSWTSKSRGGVRNYQCTPSIVDAAEFGTALQGWWNCIQPSFRKSDSGIPTAVYSCPMGDQHAWDSLRKGGPNGLISLLMLLLWWGQALAKQSQWQIDSTSDWNHMVLDVTKCLNTMKDLNGPASLKRKAATTSQDKEKKRARVSV